MDRKLCLSSTDKKLVGVCGGIAEFFKLEPTLVRIAWVLLACIGYGLPIIVYLVCWAIMPLDNK